MNEPRPRNNPSGSPRRRPFHAPSAGGDASSDAGAVRSDAHLRGTRSLDRLRERVEQAVHELRRLREENTQLAARLAELEASAGAPPPEGTVSILPEDSEALRRRVNSFIEAIDQYLTAEDGTQPAPDA